MLTLREQLSDLIESKNLVRNKWITNDKIEIYVIVGIRLLPIKNIGIPGRYGLERVQCVDVANVIVDPLYQRKGYFKAFLEDAESLCTELNIDVVYIENVINKFLHKFLMRENYKPITVGELTSYYKVV